MVFLWPVVWGCEWAPALDKVHIATGPHSHPLHGGFSAIQFPNGGRLLGYQIQVSVKAIPHEVLSVLRVGSVAQNSAIVAIHNIHRYYETMVVKEHVYSLDGVAVAPGDMVWIDIESTPTYMGSHTVPVETHISLDIDTTAVTPIAGGP